MGELKSLLSLYSKSSSNRQAMALVTVLRVQGSSYRQPGARMLISEDGEIAGSVSGGCLERDLIRQVKLLFADPSSQKIRIVTYDTTEDGDENLRSIALGCQGIIDLSIELIFPGECHLVIEAFARTMTGDVGGELLTVIESSGLNKFAAGSYFFQVPSGFDRELRLQIESDLKTVTKKEIKKYYLNGRAGEFLVLLLEKISPQVQFVIFGAGQDAVALSKLSQFMGWHTTVVDCHSAYTMPERFFFHVDYYIRCGPSEVSTRVKFSNKSLCALVTHNFYHDLEILKLLLERQVGYIGLMGPKKKGLSVLEDIRKQDPNFQIPNLSLLHSPAGLDTGADDPNGVALSIITEAIAVMSGRQGGFLKNRLEPIHNRKTL